ncbi:hypothetical protein MRX96_018696 [Rhipicephalus microplus]
MEVQVNEEDTSPEEFLEGTDWCTIGSKTQVNRANAQTDTQNGAPSCTGGESETFGDDGALEGHRLEAAWVSRRSSMENIMDFPAYGTDRSGNSPLLQVPDSAPVFELIILPPDLHLLEMLFSSSSSSKRMRALNPEVPD